jgi:hypothetical protein
VLESLRDSSLAATCTRRTSAAARPRSPTSSRRGGAGGADRASAGSRGPRSCSSPSWIRAVPAWYQQAKSGTLLLKRGGESPPTRVLQVGSPMLAPVPPHGGVGRVALTIERSGSTSLTLPTSWCGSWGLTRAAHTLPLEGFTEARPSFAKSYRCARSKTVKSDHHCRVRILTPSVFLVVMRFFDCGKEESHCGPSPAWEPLQLLTSHAKPRLGKGKQVAHERSPA